MYVLKGCLAIRKSQCKLVLGSTLRARTFSCKHGSLVIYSAGCCSGAKLFRFDPSTGQNEDYDLSSYSKSVTWLDDGVGVGWSYNGWMMGGLRFQLGMAVAQKFTLFPQTCVDPKQGLKNIRPKGSETEASVICGRLDFDIEIGTARCQKRSAGSSGLWRGRYPAWWTIMFGTLPMEPCFARSMGSHISEYTGKNCDSEMISDLTLLWMVDFCGSFILTSDNHQIPIGPIIPAAPSWFWGCQPKTMALKILIFKFPRFVFRSVCSKGISDAFRDLHPNQQTRAKGEVTHQKTPMWGFQW